MADAAGAEHLESLYDNDQAAHALKRKRLDSGEPLLNLQRRSKPIQMGIDLADVERPLNSVQRAMARSLGHIQSKAT
ncbi:MAG: hypothetical protein AAFO17_13355 [Pseudomonadota bacterium]